jgi:hypothetical protein
MYLTLKDILDDHEYKTSSRYDEIKSKYGEDIIWTRLLMVTIGIMILRLALMVILMVK